MVMAKTELLRHQRRRTDLASEFEVKAIFIALSLQTILTFVAFDLNQSSFLLAQDSMIIHVSGARSAQKAIAVPKVQQESNTGRLKDSGNGMHYYEELDVGGLRRDPIIHNRNHTQDPTCHPYFLVGTEGPRVAYRHPDTKLRPRFNAVLTYMTYENRIKETTNSLILLERHFLRRHHYPVHIFYENIDETERIKFAALIPNATSVTFERTCFNRNTPLGSPSYDVAWKMLSDLGMGWNGYAQMCRFYSGTIFMLPSLLPYEYYWRIDTDLYVTKDVEEDPFELMRRSNCSFSYYSTMETDWASVTKDLWETTLAWFEAGKEKPILGRKNIEAERIVRVKGARLDERGKYDRRGYKTHFTVSKFDVFRSDVYLSLFRYLEDSLGFYRYRWGDLPILGIGVPLVLEAGQVCGTKINVVHRGTPPL